MQKYVLTGAPGAGKTSLIIGLELRGEATVREAARDLLLFRRGMGENNPIGSSDWEDTVLRLHLQRERSLPPSLRRVFLDRGAPDHVAYAEVFGWPLSAELREQALRTSYTAVCLIERDKRRKGDDPAFVHAENLERKLSETYTGLGYHVVHIPYEPLDQRLRTFMEIVRQLELGANL